MKKTIVLIHGAFAGDYAWNKITPLLEAKGNKVITLNLPAHGDDNFIISALPIDQFGLFRFPVHTLNLHRLLGVVLLVTGVYLVKKY